LQYQPRKRIKPLSTELILYAVVAAGLVYWLRSVLGTRHGEERERPNPFTQPAEKSFDEAQAPAAKIQGEEDDIFSRGLELPTSLPRGVSVEGPMAEGGISDIAQAMRDFNLGHFAQGAQDAFVIIVEAFAQNDRETLQGLLAPHVYAAFEGALKLREENGESVSTEIHSVRKSEILKAGIIGGEARIVVRFIADETCVIRDREGNILSGDPDRITEMNDIWTFARDVKSRDPRWLLVETSDGDVNEDAKTPVPDSITV
jgi:predicted lipid-binding transport protein (Tim44 family)